MSELWQIRFERNSPPYFVGDIAGFPQEKAEAFLKTNGCTLVQIVGEDGLPLKSVEPEPVAPPAPQVEPPAPPVKAAAVKAPVKLDAEALLGDLLTKP